MQLLGYRHLSFCNQERWGSEVCVCFGVSVLWVGLFLVWERWYDCGEWSAGVWVFRLCLEDMTWWIWNGVELLICGFGGELVIPIL